MERLHRQDDPQIGAPPSCPSTSPARIPAGTRSPTSISPILRQGLLIHEVVHSFDKPQAPIIGKPDHAG
jgi:hypothetical protein